MSESREHHPDAADHIRPLAAIILAAGRGTRMNSDLPKVALPVAGRAMVWWVVDAVRQIGVERIILIIGHGAESVREVFAENDHDLEFVIQSEQLGTGHAVQVAESLLEGFDGDVLVLAGDGPLIRAETLDLLIDRHRSTCAAATLATAMIDDPTGYGRIVRDAAGRFAAIVEHRNATESQRRIGEINPSYYCFDAAALFCALREMERDAVSGEFYLTDVPSILKHGGKIVEVIDAVPAEDVLSINTPEQLADVDRILTARLSVRQARIGLGRTCL